LPVEPPVEPIPSLCAPTGPRTVARRAARGHPAFSLADPAILGRDTRRKSAETMRAALLTNQPQNVITPEMY
jgi:C-terminal binding protein